MLEGEQHNIPSPERMNPKFDPEDPLATINYCLHKLTGAVPIFFTRRDRQNIENFLQNKSIPFFTLQSGERLSRNQITEYFNEYENSMYRNAALNKIFNILDLSVYKLNDEHGKELEKKEWSFLLRSIMNRNKKK
ncbi:hypothetical protein A2641_03020 [Candidatus Nomurabacteria bacterium RIFCSPHIGHO2_01_FULL_37_25]|uniref:Uncharacterized protein n=1 Tax=Candidatus Nomurabacteria bacterium RIFCSPLOWO2_01_FULL_36_16 TaxID=1801767 RepID=A0A1F6WZK4_9BACT|nr:MAG: hypothetical protein A2641_03020 [Candidatus Nomurabacteria bacterium RIFCSPHIGHO2_01_FULL_37_25]OGI75464.1 MAG: hypothetical protein A3D36_02660 [Candidatus Nomurabacteria bacterium RIFCSPHIGHO2_02_FULL_36_29]OGI87303.1 MAG: hypothetical protein A3A91_02285 [Candidatus Nomurabacteria bacterium RIFCSPLOWO2_01_FULL_36_16]OGI94816.1 MAG: hypothetical protein A3I84_03150 [Candidatus Nomurabacteria bacterium RIFCSPLOWO2_02_FULL_36_8]